MPNSRHIRRIALLSLFLIAAAPAPHHHRVHKTTTAEQEKPPNPATLNPKPTPAEINNYTSNYYYPPAKPKGLPVRFQELTTILLVGFNTALIWFTHRSLLETRRTNELARKTLLITQRPKLIVRNVSLKPFTSTHEPPNPQLIRGDQPVSGQLYLSNQGGTTATLTASHCLVWWQRGPLPHLRPYEGADANNFVGIRQKIEPGDALTFFFSSTPRVIAPEEANQLWQGGEGWHLWVMGWVEYMDELPRPGKMAFCRVFDKVQNRFLPVDNPRLRIRQ